MAELEFVGFDATGKEIEAPQGADTYVAKKAAKFEQPVSLNSTMDGRDIATDGTKLDLITVTAPVDLDAIAAAQGPGAVILMPGVWDASLNLFPVSTLVGETWICSTAGWVDGVQFKLNDRVTALINNAGTSTYVGNWIQTRYNDSVISVAGKAGAVILEEADISDLQAYLLPSSVDALTKLNALVLDATLGDAADFATAAQGVLASSALQSIGWKRQMAALIGATIGSGTPSLAPFGPSGVSQAKAFAIGDSVYVASMVPHDALGGGSLFPVMSWSTNGNSVNSVKWEISHTFANGYNTTTFPANSVITLEEAASGIAWQHMTSLGGSGVPGIEIGGACIAEIKRISNGGTDNLDIVFGLFSGFHYPTNKFDTLNKEPPFFV